MTAKSLANPRARLLILVRAIPPGRVATLAALAEASGLAPALVATTLARLSDDERQTVPWHRVVANGGAIGRGAWREAQFAKLVREGIAVSPAGVVQDLERALMSDFDGRPAAQPLAGAGTPQPQPKERSRGMKDRPR